MKTTFQPFTSSPGSAEYVRVRCVICGWEDGLRADLVAAGQMVFYCDRCDWSQACELIPLNDTSSHVATENRNMSDESKPLRARSRLAATIIMAGVIGGLHPMPKPKPKRKCLLAFCDILTDHNGGYCSAEHKAQDNQ